MFSKSRDSRLEKILKNEGFNQLREALNVVLNQPVWWYCTGTEEAVRIIESHNKTGCGLLHDDRAIRAAWHDAVAAALWQVSQDKVALMTACPPDHTQVIVPVLCGEELQGFIGLSHLPSYEQHRLFPLLPLLTQHLRQIAEQERALEDLHSVRRLWKEVISILDHDLLLSRILEEIIILLDTEEGVLLLINQQHRLVRSATYGFAPDSPANQDYSISSTPYENKVFSWPQAAQMLSEGDPLRQWYLGLHTPVPPGLGVWGVPFSVKGKMVGMVLCSGKEGSLLTSNVDSALETLAEGAGIAIRNARELSETQQKTKALASVHAVHRFLSSVRSIQKVLDKKQVLSRIATLITQVVSVGKCSIMMLDENQILQPLVTIGLEPLEIGTIPLKLDEGIPGKVAHEGISLQVDSPLLDNRFNQDPSYYYPSRSYMSVPIVDEEVIGVITVAERRGNPPRFVEGDMEVLHTLVEQAVMALPNIDFYDKQQRIALRTMEVFNNLMETGDPDQPGNAQKLASLIEQFAQHLKLDEQTCRLFQMAAFIHGITLLLPDPVLNSFHHAEMAVRMAKRLEMPDQVIAILRDHHENFDGSGGPRRLQGEEIPLGARMLALTDHALHLSGYNLDLLFSEGDGVITQIRQLSGQALDPNLVDSLAHFLESGKDVSRV
jgi:HD-GYP domain-containing protein (c-di-GMP phosphodiesterase class II)